MGKSKTIDLNIIGPVLILFAISSIILQSLLPSETLKHLFSHLIALLTFYIFTKIDYRFFLSLVKYLYVFSLVLLLLTFLLGEPTRGSIRWIRLGVINIQTSELIKPLIIISLANFAARLNLKKIYDILRYLLLMAFPIVLILFQPDLGSALVLAVIGISIGYTSGFNPRFMLLSLLILIILTPTIYGFLKPYQQERIKSFIDPFSDPLGSGYSVIQSMIAVGSGKVFGRGLGHGTQSQLRFIPESHSDFIFASLAEELGLFGILLTFISYYFLLNRILTISEQSSDNLGSLICIGVFSMIFFQLVVNVGMNIGLLPVTGITLPLISSGGSSSLTVMASLGIVQSVSKLKKPVQTIEIR